MFAQATVVHAPQDAMQQVRELIQMDYLPLLAKRDGFVSAHLLEQVDDPEHGLLIVYWRDHKSVESFHNTSALQASLSNLAAQVPGLKLERDGFVVTLDSVAQPAVRR